MLKLIKALARKVLGHVEKETLSVEVNLPTHDQRGNGSPLFERTRKQLIARDEGCFICGSKSQLEAHHSPVEWSFALAVDFGPESIIRKDFPLFDWATFDSADPYTFVDDMTVNGKLLCKTHHVGKDCGIHALPHPIWVIQRYIKEGYQFSDIEIIHHEYP